VPLKLRSYQPTDFEKLFEIDQACYEPEIAYSRRELKNYLRFPSADCIVAEINGTPVGFCMTAIERADGYIITMDVLSEFRRHGVGAALLQEAEARMAEQGVLEVRLETAVDNASGIAFWKKHGYRTKTIRKGYYPGNRDAFSMLKKIAR
jgi:ribosomal protein S18 acetylase RimI-like enzyme